MNDELTELLAAARKVAEAARPKEFEVDLGDFLSRFYEDVAPEDLIGKDPMDVVGPATHMLRLGANRPQGTGLGLPISRQIVEHFGGRMGLRDDTAQGACFWFTLPLTAETGDLP